MEKYEINFKRFALLMLPTFMRKSTIVILLYAAVSGITWIHTHFILFFRDSLFRLTHNGQVCHLRGVLNEYFDPVDRRFTISENAEGSVNSLVYEREMDLSKPIPMRDSYMGMTLARRGSTNENGYDFWVNIPYKLFKEGKINEPRLKAIINMYKLASKRYGLNYK